MSRALPFVLLLSLLFATACARAIDVGSDPRPTYRIAVQNQLAQPMIVSYNDARGEALLGTVPAGRTEHFVIAGSAAASVVLTARNAAGTLVRTYTIQLTAGQTQTVQLR